MVGTVSHSPSLSVRLFRAGPAAVVVAGLLAACLPLLVLAFYNHASPADDYCFADTTLRFGYWQAQRYYYDGWSGRYFHNFIVHASPLVWHWTSGYTVFPIAVLLSLIGAAWLLIREATRGVLTTGAQVGLAAGLSLLFLTNLVSVSEFLYWLPGVASISLSWVLTLVLLTLLLRHNALNFGWQLGLLLAEAALVVAIVGSSETSLLVWLAVLGLVGLQWGLVRRSVPVGLLVLAVVTVVSAYFLITAPGNFIRLAGNTQRFTLVQSLVAAFQFDITLILNQFRQTPLLPLTVLALPVLYRVANADGRLTPALRVHPLLALAQWIATVLVLTALHYYAVGIGPVFRLINFINLAFVLGWVYTGLVLLRFIGQRRNATPGWASPNVIISAIAGLGLLFTLWKSPALRLTYGDWLSGRAAQYDRAMTDRYRILADTTPESGAGSNAGAGARAGAGNVQLDPLPVAPVSLVVEDIRTDARHWWNRCWASYYHRKTIVLRPVSPSVRR